MNLTQPALLLTVLLALSPLSTGAEKGPSRFPSAARVFREDPVFSGLPRAARRDWEQWMAQSAALRDLDARELTRELLMTGRREIVPAKKTSKVPLPQKPADWYDGPEARRTADFLMTWQTPSGGWTKNLNLARRPRQPGQHWSPHNKWDYVATIDNKATTGEIEFLARTATALGAEGEPYRRAAGLGMHYLLAAQMPSGGWPQVYPLQGYYHDHITFNDDAMVHVLTLLRKVAAGEEPYAFTGPEMRRNAAAAVRRGVDCILRCQITVDGRPAAWCAQHHAITLAPIPARAYEPASLSGSESVNILRFLMSLDPDTPGVRKAIENGVSWFRRVRLKPGQAGVEASRTRDEWARFYQIGTNRPIFSDTDGKIRYSFKEVKNKKNTYSWFTTIPAKLLSADYPKWREKQSKAD